MLNVEERRGYQALIALGSLLGMLVSALLLTLVDWDLRTDATVVVGCTVLAGVVTWPLARREARAWERRRRERDAA